MLEVVFSAENYFFCFITITESSNGIDDVCSSKDKFFVDKDVVRMHKMYLARVAR